MTDPRDGKQKTLSLDVLAQEPDRLRVDVTSHLGSYVGTFSSEKGRFAFLSAVERRFLTGPAQSSAARELLRLSVDPKEAVAFLLDGAPPEGWSCSSSASTSVRRCEKASAKAKVEIEPDAEGRRFAFYSPGASAPVRLRLVPVRGAPPEDRQFLLQKPSGFEAREVGAPVR